MRSRDGVGGRCVQFVDDAAVGQEHNPVGVGGRSGVVGDHDDRLTEFGHGVGHEGEDLAPRSGIEVSGWFVGEDDLGPARQRSGYGHSLLLAAR